MSNWRVTAVNLGSIAIDWGVPCLLVAAVAVQADRYLTDAVPVVLSFDLGFQLAAVLALAGLWHFHRQNRRLRGKLDRLALYESALDQASSGISIAEAKGADSPLIYVNQAFCRMTGYTAKELLGGDCRFLRSGDTDTGERRRVAAAIAAGQPIKARLVNRRKDGREFINLIDIRPIRGQKGDVSFHVAVQEDITDVEARDREEAFLSAQNDAIFSSAPNAILVVDSDGRIVKANDQAETLFGWPFVDLISQPIDTLVPAEFRERHGDLARAYRDNPNNQRLLMGSQRPAVFGLRKDGSRFPAYVTLSKTVVEGDPLTIAIVQDQTEISQKNAQLRSLNASLVDALEESRASHQAKEKFLAMISHELRTPLNAILGFTDMIRSETLGPIGTPRYLDYLGDIGKSADILLSHVEDLLAVSKMRSGHYELDIVAVSVTEPVSDAVAMVQPQAKAKQVALSLDAEETPTIRSNHRAIQQIVVNLLTNAVKFTDTGGTVSVAVRQDPATLGVVVRVVDSGAGINTDALTLLGQPFETNDRDPFVNQETGIGLGLYISRSLANALGGSLKLDSKPDVGTTGVLVLPYERASDGSPDSAGDLSAVASNSSA